MFGQSREKIRTLAAAASAQMARVSGTWIVMIGLLMGSVPAQALTEQPLHDFTCNVQEARLGCQVSSAGDFNADGHVDVLAGTKGFDVTGPEVYLYFGGPGADDLPDLLFTGETESDHFGESLASAGDLNGDGHDDIVIGAGSADPDGKVYVYFGGPSADSIADVIISSPSSYSFGSAVAGAGDINADGFDDILVGAPFSSSGSAFVFLGGAAMDTQADLTLLGPASDSRFGWSVSGAGDVNGDGYADVIVGAPYLNSPYTACGAAYVYLGGQVPSSTPALSLIGESQSDVLGKCVAGIGDLNGDDLDDFAISSPGHFESSAHGRIFVFLGRGDLSSTPDLVITGPDEHEFGADIAGAGDVNADGFADLIVSHHKRPVFGGDHDGAAHIYLGGREPDDLIDLTLLARAPEQMFGGAVASAGDIDEDGNDDVIIGAPLEPTGNLWSHVYVLGYYPLGLYAPNGGETLLAGAHATVSWRGADPADLALSFDAGFTWTTFARDVGGKAENSFILTVPAMVTDMARLAVFPTGATASAPGGDVSAGVFRIVSEPASLDAAYARQLELSGQYPGDFAGCAVASVGDMNGDGFDDLLVGARAAGSNQTGCAYVHCGGPGADDVADLVLTGTGTGDEFGGTVAAAGDYNADGYADWLVGARYHDTGGADAGRAYLYSGGPSADAVADYILSGEAVGDQFGAAAAPAGDLNGDGYGDVVIGAPSSVAGGSGPGHAYVFLGGPASDDAPDVVLTGEPTHSQFGSAVSTAGDFNGDGFDDLIVGAYLHGAQGPMTGQVYVYFGGPDLDDAPDLVLTGEAAGDGFGYALASIGSINGYAYSSIIVGAPWNDAAGTNAGRAYVFLGGAAADAYADIVLTGDGPEDRFGIALTSAGDVNADGFADFAAGASNQDAGGGLTAGKVYLYLGGSVRHVPAVAVFPGQAVNDQFGRAIAGGGDLNGDGLDDLIIGAPYADATGGDAGQAYVYDFHRYRVLVPNAGDTWVCGETATVSWTGDEPADIWLQTDGDETRILLAGAVGGRALNSVPVTVPHQPSASARVVITPSDPEVTGRALSAGSLRIVKVETPPAAAALVQAAPGGEQGGTNFGGTVAPAGDVNGDGFGDFLVGAPFFPLPVEESGRAYLYYGGPEADETADLVIAPLWGEGQFGTTLAPAGDINGDGYDDFLIGSPSAGAGRVDLYFGGIAPDATPDLQFTGAGTVEYLGAAVAGGHDFNGDGYPDVLIGAPSALSGSARTGRAYVFYGGPLLDATADLLVNGEVAQDRCGHAVAFAGDLNGDGYCDALVGAPEHDAPSANAGRVYVLFGGPAADGVADLAIDGGAAVDDNFGCAVSGAGDVDGDGCADYLVGAHKSDLGGGESGCACLYLGGRVLDDEAALVLPGAAAADYFGRSVTGGGDLNGDGFGDFAVSAYTNDAGGAQAGRVYVYYGGAVPDAEADAVLTGEAAGDEFGGCIALTPDLNDDGGCDLLIGAMGNDQAGTDFGRAYLHDFARYHLLAPRGGETWDVGALQAVTWLGAEPADLWLSVDGGATYDLLASGLGGQVSNAFGLRVPHQPTRFARVKLTPADAALAGCAASARFFTIDATIALLDFRTSPPPGGGDGLLLSWNTNPGPEALSAYRIDRSQEAAADLWVTIAQTKATSLLDESGSALSSYRLFAVNGLGEEFLLGEISGASLLSTPLAAWPLPFRGGALNVRFATGAGPGGSRTVTEVGVYDVGGRLIRQLAHGAFGAGVQQMSWDGRDGHGARVRGGVYFLRAVTAGHCNTLKLMVVR